MKRALKVTILIIPFLLATGVFWVSAQNEPARGTIRGGVYIDADGNGRCGIDYPVPNIDIVFVNGNNRVSLHTGSNGTFGLPAAGRGTWQVTALPDPAKWIVTSENPLLVTVFEDEGLLQTNVNFCVKGGGAPMTTTSAATAAGTPTPDDQTGDTTTTNSTTATTTNELSANYSVSEALLSSSATLSPVENLTEVATVAAPTGTEWLDYLNLFRDMAGLPRFTEIEVLSDGGRLHSKYMVLNDKPIAHHEDENNPLFSSTGQQAAINGNLFATNQIQADYVWSINFWTSAPFHLMPIINPTVDKAGYGRYNQAAGDIQMAAVLDVRTEVGNAVNEPQYPIYFPGDGAETWIVRRSLYEWPDPLGNCAGYSVPTGPALILQLGDGSLTPKVQSHKVFQGDELIDSCTFDETNYVNSDAFAQKTGRSILDEQDAIVVIPKNQLPINETYTVQLVVNDQPYSWSFSTRKGPPGS